MDVRYTPSGDGFRIVGGGEIFNRALYGGHGQDNLPERYFTAAGDAPLVMGAISDWRKREDCSLAKCGTFMAGVAVSPGLHLPQYYYAGEKGGDRTAEWFHQSPGTVSTFRPGWMEYGVRPFFQCYPVVDARIAVLPLQSCDGFLVELSVSADQREILVLAFGGITDFLGSILDPNSEARAFRPSDCSGNSVRVTGPGRAEISGPPGVPVRTVMRIGASFPMEFTVGDAERTGRPGLFLADGTGPVDAPMVRMSRPVGPGETLHGFFAAVRNAPEEALESLLASPDPAGEARRAIGAKTSCFSMRTPDRMLDLTAAPNVIALDAAWHADAFCHGAFSWHCPYLGWRNWYGPTVLGWKDRVRTAFRTHASFQVKAPESDGAAAETVVYDGPGPYSRLENSHGFIPEIPDGRRTIFYNMQEVGIDMALHAIEWTGDLAHAAEIFNSVSEALDWEERILDPDADGLYQNRLNTWISDAHSYNGGGCAQASAYNYRANRVMASIAGRIGRDPRPFERRAERIRAACRDVLWLPDRGVLAEYVDTVGNRLIHPSPELATAYHAIEADLVDGFQAYQMLRFTETGIRNARAGARGGRLVWSSNWLPQLYSSCGLYTAENLHLAWAYFRCGLVEKGHEILRAVVDAHFLSRSPGLAGHCMTEGGYSGMSEDFTEISSLHLRTVVEGVFGIRPDLLRGTVTVAPNLPGNWRSASIRSGPVRVRYGRRGRTETFTVRTEPEARIQLRIRLRGTRIEGVTVNGGPVAFHIEPAVGSCVCVVEAGVRRAVVRVTHGGGALPALEHADAVEPGTRVAIGVLGGILAEVEDPSGFLDASERDARGVRGTAQGAAGGRTVFLRVRAEHWDGWLPADLVLAGPPASPPSPALEPSCFRPIPIDAAFNMDLSRIHDQEYREPRPKGHSIMCCLNGRFGWDWNQAGFARVEVDDSALRGCGGIYRVASGLPFRTPAAGPNAACVSVWENFPEELHFPLSGTAREAAVFLIGVTNPMQSRVENGRVTVEYADGGRETVSLVNPGNFDDWLVSAVQRENETVCFSPRNHGMVQRIGLDPGRALARLSVRAVANEVVVGVIGITLGI